jgi:hypothetical protein
MSVNQIMRNFSNVFAATLILLSVLGCGFTGSSDKSGSNRSLQDEAVDTAVGKSKIGVPECDQVMDELTAEMNNPDDNFVTKAIKATFLNRIKDSIRESVEKNPDDKIELAKTCKEFKAQLDKYKAEEAANKNQN